jgi:N-acetylglutamate synthase-like GNAT family acetyltransferase
MEEGPYQARRATVEDLPELEALWTEAGLPAAQLGPFLAEFQAAQQSDGRIAGVVGLLLEQDSALLHSEALASWADEDAAREVLWRRVKILARNHGVRAVWTREDAPYWATCGFEPATGAERPAFARDEPEGWRAVVIGDPQQAQAVVNEQMAIWQATRIQEAERLQSSVKLLRNLAAVLVGLVICGFLGGVIYVFALHPELLRRLFGGR